MYLALSSYQIKCGYPTCILGAAAVVDAFAAFVVVFVAVAAAAAAAATAAASVAVLTHNNHAF